MPDLVDIQQRVTGHELVRGTDQVPRGHIRLETAFLYPDGGSVDVFVVDGPGGVPAKLSDLGQTISWLLDVQVRPWLSKKRQRFVEDTLRIYGVEQTEGALELPLERVEDLIPGVVRLGQACVRVADLIYTRRSSLQLAFDEEVEEVLADSELTYEPNKDLRGRAGRVVRVDFLVQGARTKSAILGLSSGHPSKAHSVANEIFRRWYDLDIPERSEQKVTIFDDRVDVYRPEDLERLEELSRVVALSERTTIRDLLAA